MHRPSLIMLIAFGAVFGTLIARAGELRVPVNGDPALYLDMPPGWNASYDQYGNLHITAADQSSGVQLSIGADPEVATASMDEIAADIIKAAGASPYFRTGPGMVGWHAGQAYYSNIINNDVHLNLKVVTAKLDDTHAAFMTIITRDNLTAAQSASLSALIEDVRLTRAK